MRLGTTLALVFIIYLSVLPWFHTSVFETSPHRVEEAYHAKWQPLETSNESSPLESTIGRMELNRDGRRMLFLRNINGSAQLFLKEEGGIETKLSPEKERVLSFALSQNGLFVSFLSGDSIDGPLSLYIWEDGFPVRKIIDASFIGNWGVSITEAGERVLVYPHDRSASFQLSKESRELFNGANWTASQGLIVSFSPRAGSKIYENENMKEAERRFSVAFIHLAGGVEVAHFETPSEILTWNNTHHAPERVALSRSFPLDFDADKGDDLLLFKQNADLPLWSVMTLGGRDGPTGAATGGDAKYGSWRLGDGAGLPVPGDYNGDGVLDLATFTPFYASTDIRSRANWQIFLSQSPDVVSNGAITLGEKVLSVSWGLGNMLPVPADYDGDGATDIATWDPATGNWHILFSQGGFDVTKALHREKNFGARLALGKKGDVPVPADYDGNGQTDLAVSGVSIAGQRQWAIYFMGGSRKDNVKEFTFGLGEDIPFGADFNCDGDAEAAVYRPSERAWYVRFAEGKVDRLPWGIDTAYPILGDFDADGCTDFGFYSPQTIHKWYLMSSRFRKGVYEYFPAGRTAITGFVWGGIGGALPPQVWLRDFAVTQARAVLQN